MARVRRGGPAHRREPRRARRPPRRPRRDAVAQPPELAVVDAAALHLGAATVALYTASPAATIAHILRDCAPRVLAVESALAGRLRDVEHGVEHVVRLDGDGGVLPAFAGLDGPPGFSFDAVWRSVRPGDLAYVLYTSGTTGLPKGAEWEHGAALRAARRFGLHGVTAQGARDLSVLPFAHALERGAGHLRAMLHGATRTFCADPAQLGPALLDARPTFVVGPPRIWQALRNVLEATLVDADRAAIDRGGPAAALAALRGRIGLDEVASAMTAAAPCPEAIRAFFAGVGLPLGELYGMTELFGVTVTRAGGCDAGTCGPPLEGCELRLAPDGELEVRSGGQARGYRNEPAQTAATFAGGGWVRTGDIGRLDGAGRLLIVDRKKELLIPSHGHNVAPAPIESELKSLCPQIGHVCLVGDARPHVAALVVLDPPGRPVDDAARAAVAAACERLNAGLDPRERVLAHAVLAEPWLPGRELTETQKLRRRRIAELHAATIDALYATGAP